MAQDKNKNVEKRDEEDPQVPDKTEIDSLVETETENPDNQEETNTEEDFSSDELDTLEYENSQEKEQAEYEAQKKKVQELDNKVAAARDKMNKYQLELEKLMKIRDTEVRKMESLSGSKHSNARAIRNYIESQKQMRIDRAKSRQNLERVLGGTIPDKMNKAQSPLDASLNTRKPAPGSTRPDYTKRG